MADMAAGDPEPGFPVPCQIDRTTPTFIPNTGAGVRSDVNSWFGARGSFNGLSPIAGRLPGRSTARGGASLELGIGGATQLSDSDVRPFGALGGARGWRLRPRPGDGGRGAWGVRFPGLIGAGGAALFAPSLQALPAPPAPARQIDPAQAEAAASAFPGLSPPIAVVVPPTFAVAFRGLETRPGILAMGLGLLAVNRLPMSRSRAILCAIGPVPPQPFGVLQLAPVLQLPRDAVAMP